MFGASAALFSGVSVWNVLSTVSVLASCMRAVLALLLVMKYVPSAESCRSVTTSMCARSFESTSSPVCASKSATLPDSWPVRISPGVYGNAHTVALLPTGWKSDAGSRFSVVVVVEEEGVVRTERWGEKISLEAGGYARSVPSPSRLMSKMRMAPWWPMRCSVMQTTCVSSSEKETRLTAVGNSHTKRHFPVCTDQRRISLSAEPETRKCDCAGCPGSGRDERLTRRREEGDAHAHTHSRRLLSKSSRCVHCRFRDALH